MSNPKNKTSESHIKAALPRANSSTEDASDITSTLSFNSDTQPMRNWVPQIPSWMYLVAIIAGILGGFAPRWFDIPQAFAWIRYPSSQPIAGLFCFGISLAVFRFIQLFIWMVSRKEWSTRADQHANSRLAIADNGLTPEAIQTLAYKDVCRSMRTIVLFPHWMMFLICFALLIAAIPIFILHLKMLGRQTDLLSALWVPGTVILAASVIWLLTICSSAFAAYAIQSWYSESMELYAKRHAAALTELSAASDTKSPSEGLENSSNNVGGLPGWNAPYASPGSGETDEESGDYDDPVELRQDQARGAGNTDGFQQHRRNHENQSGGPHGSSKRATNGYDGTDDGDAFNPTE